ncbi:Uncharacterized protein Fot_39560 [Forsythia ovata]|uniref:Uncharacterized protein n=1 Tax=Forsythia ovata TaxID=205694 RepID=A0ABD1S7H1_9LAMI
MRKRGRLIYVSFDVELLFYLPFRFFDNHDIASCEKPKALCTTSKLWAMCRVIKLIVVAAFSSTNVTIVPGMVGEMDQQCSRVQILLHVLVMDAFPITRMVGIQIQFRIVVFSYSKQLYLNLAVPFAALTHHHIPSSWCCRRVGESRKSSFFSRSLSIIVTFCHDHAFGMKPAL